MNITNCPICTVKLKKKENQMTCPECGYSYYLRLSTNTTSSKNTRDISKSTPNAAPKSTPKSTPKVTPKATPKATPKFLVPAIILIIMASFIVPIAATLFTLNTHISYSVSEAISEIDTSYTETEEIRTLPESEFFQDLIFQVFGKEYTQVSPDELAQITELHLYYDEDNQNCVYVLLADSSICSYYANDELYLDTADLSCFSGVIALTLGYGNYISDGDLSGMTNLTSISSDMSLNELSASVPYPEKITSIEINSTIFMDSFAGIEAFPNLVSLSADCMDMEDISALKEVPSLEHLSLISCDWLEDFSPLYDMTNLKSLCIESYSLKDIGFVKNMPNLAYLAISRGEGIKSVDALESRADSLQYLYLDDTWDVTDYSVLESMPNLIELEFVASYDEVLPSLSHMENLNYLGIYGAGDFSNFSVPSSLTALSLESCNCESLSFISNCPNLMELYLEGMSGYFVSLEPVMSLANLKVLSISNSTAYANAESLLSIPTLESFYMDGCNIGFNMSNIPYNESLQILDMSEVLLYDISSANDYGWLEDYDQVILADHGELFANFPNLQQLSLRENNLEDLSFLSEGGLEQLQLLDISDNYITDLSPLADFRNLSQVKCAGNPIADTAELDNILLR